VELARRRGAGVLISPAEAARADFGADQLSAAARGRREVHVAATLTIFRAWAWIGTPSGSLPTPITTMVLMMPLALWDGVTLRQTSLPS